MLTPIPPAYTIAKASYPSLQKDHIPGPTDYDPYRADIRASVPAYSFTKSPRKIHNSQDIPGPGLYDSPIMKRSPGYSVGRSPRILSNIRYRSPGPGDYDYEKMQARYKYSISKAKNRSYCNSESPGPGFYSPNLTVNIESSPRMKFSRQPRMPPPSFLTPAPGQYQLPNVGRSPGYTIPKAMPKPKEPSSPGPGFYRYTSSTIGIASMKST